MKTVIVDDEILAVNLLDHLLKEIDGVRVVGAFTSEEEALAAIRSLKPDLIFLDIDMPVINGIEMAASIQADGSMADIVYITAYDHYAIQAFEVNAVDYILKPTDKVRLSKTVETIVKRRSRPPLAASLPGAPEAKKGLRANMMGDFVLFAASGLPVKWRTRKVKEFCAYLLHQDRPVHRFQVIEDLWPGVSVQKATSLLYSTVYQLRRVFHEQAYPQSIAFVDERFALLADVATDVGEIKALLGGNQEEEPSFYRLLELIQRDYLNEEDYPWSIGESEALRSACKRFLETGLLSRQGEHWAAHTRELVLKKLLKLDPLNEQYGILNMKHYIALGAYGKAKEIYMAYKESVWTELGIRAQPHIDEVFAEIS